jgi:hypothetical protein
MRKSIGSYLLDISKLIFAGVVLSTVLKIEDVSRISVLISGTIATVTFAITGFLLIWRG